MRENILKAVEENIGLGGATIAGQVNDRFESLASMMQKPQIVSAIIEDIATVAHQAWKQDHFAMRGEGEPRWKGTKDAAYEAANIAKADTANFPWFRVSEGKFELNIAALDYDKLPTDWQAENRATGEVVCQLLRDAIANGTNPMSPEFLNAAANEVHIQWLVRNGEYAPEFQKKSLEEMIVTARDSQDENQVLAYRTFVMDLNYLVQGVAAMLKYESISNLGLSDLVGKGN